MVKRVILLLLIATGGWWLYDGGLAKLRHRVDRFGSPLKPAANLGGNAEDVLCLQAARRALQSISSELGALPPPPLDGDVWSAVLLRAGGEISDAEGPCRCSSPACGRALEALGELRSAVQQIDGMIRGQSSAFGNPASHLENAEQMLDQARNLSGG
jgi:hypothetical protein